MSTENLHNYDGVKKIKELAESIDFAMFATSLDNKPFHVIPMSTKKVDGQGNIWFLSGADSDHNSHIRNDDKVQLIYSDPGSMEFLTVYGEATITQDKQILEELYDSSDDAWFNGINDPNLTAISVHPEKAHYWDTKTNKLIALVKIGIGAVTGDEPDLGVEGNITM